MKGLYLISSDMMILLITVMLCALMAQIVCITYDFLRLREKNRNINRMMLNLSILSYLLIHLYITGLTFFNQESHMFVLHSMVELRIVSFLLISVFSISEIWYEKDLTYISPAAAAFLSLPPFENFFGDSFGRFFITVSFFWPLYGINQLFRFRKIRKEQLSVFSVKEALDTMDFGLLYCRGEGPSDGQILLLNNKMQELMCILMGQLIYNGKTFFSMLEAGNVLHSCTRSEAETETVYTLPDGSIWRFDMQPASIKSMNGFLLIASDVTRLRKATYVLYEQNAELEKRNAGLREMLRNLESVCRTEETLRAKNWVHDLLGQRISLILRSIRENREPDTVLLQSFADGLPEELKKTPASAYSLDKMIKNFEGLGVKINVEGVFPEDYERKRIFSEIIAEAMTNAVRHGYATEITIETDLENGVRTLDITDNGIPSGECISEGGGLKGMRSKAMSLGGDFSYETVPHFRVLVTVPEKDI